MDWLLAILSDPARILSILALLFTIFSFWWMNWRRGKLRVSKPRSGSIHIPQHGNLVTRLPYSFFNDGPTPIIIANLRLVLIGENINPLFFSAINKAIEKDLDRIMATQIAIAGRQASVMICEFQQDVGDFAFEAKTYAVDLQAKLGEDSHWKSLVKFELNLKHYSSEALEGSTVTFDNMMDY